MDRTQRGVMKSILLTLSVLAAGLALPAASFGQENVGGAAAGGPSGRCFGAGDPLGVNCKGSSGPIGGGCGNAGGATGGSAGCDSRHRMHGARRHHPHSHPAPVHTPHSPSGHASGGTPKPQLAQ
jgi:hypothetical protein